MFLNKPGKMIEYWFFEIEKHFCQIKCIANQVMPNHIHCFIEITKCEKMTGEVFAKANTSRPNNLLATRPSASSLFQVLQWFKTMTTNDYIKNVKENHWLRFEQKLWQRSYYEHVIRDEDEFEHAILYIQRNPERWLKDEYNL